jgi:hypothetical protein
MDRLLLPVAPTMPNRRCRFLLSLFGNVYQEKRVLEGVSGLSSDGRESRDAAVLLTEAEQSSYD